MRLGLSVAVDQCGVSRVFDPFYRLEESRSRETGGVGLGLAIAQSIVQAHRGELVLSNRPTAGLRVRIPLPRWKADQGWDREVFHVRLPKYLRPAATHGRTIHGL